MKGIVFCEFIEMVNTQFSEEMSDDLIDATDPASGGVYTTVGTYDYNELVAMVVELSKRVNAPVPDLIHAFGLHLSKVFASKFNDFFSECATTVDFLKRIDNHIHVEVRKLYPDAELPVFSYEDLQEGQFKLTYESQRNFADLAHGLIEGCATYYNESFVIERHSLPSDKACSVEFILRPAAEAQ